MPAVLRRILLVTIALAVLVLIPFLIWGDALDLSWLRGHPGRVAALGIVLLSADLVLPIPASAVFTGMGAELGPLWGAVAGTVGSFVSGLIGYTVARLGSSRFLHWLAKPEEIAPFRAWFDRWGGLAVAAGRSFPILPEVTVVLAGLSAMPPARFLLALLLGSAANAVVYAGLGARLPPLPALLIASILPAIGWGWVAWRRREKR